MSIVTRKGDGGYTYLGSGQKVPKDDSRIELYGTIDELCSHLGLAKSLVAAGEVKRLIESLQEDIFMLCAEVASGPWSLKSKISVKDVARLEAFIAALEAKRPFKAKCFCLQGQGTASAALDIARAVARRAERRLVALKRKRVVKNEAALKYLNRLSDLLYLLARYQEGRSKTIKLR